jgi:feruloyl-CoA synthase
LPIWLATPATAAVDAAMQATGPDTIVKFLFTSGSTKLPKAVINTHRMWCANQQQMRQCHAGAGREPPVLVDWLPWNHTFGGNHNFGMVLYNGGTLYIDDGKPTPALMPRRCATCARSRPRCTSTCPPALRRSPTR